MNCVRSIKNIRLGTQHLTTLTATQCVPIKGTERLISAFIKPEQLKPGLLAKKPSQDRATLATAMSAWRKFMRQKMPDFKAKQYKYIILASVEG